MAAGSGGRDPGGWAAGAASALAPAQRRRVRLSRPGVPGHPALWRASSAQPGRGRLGRGQGLGVSGRGFLPCSQPGPGSRGRGGGQVLACASPSCPAPGPRFRRPGADGRRPARLPARGRVCSDGRGSQSWRGEPAPAGDLPWALCPGTQDPQPSSLVPTGPGSVHPRTHESRPPVPRPSDPPVPPEPSAFSAPGVCCLVLVALSLWPDIAAAPGPPPGPPRASADPRAELDSAVLLSRSLLADTRQLAAQLVGETGGDGREPGPGVTEWVSGLPPRQRGGGRNLRLVGGGACGPRSTEQRPPHKPLSPRETNSQPTGTTTWIPCPPWP